MPQEAASVNPLNPPNQNLGYKHIALAVGLGAMVTFGALMLFGVIFGLGWLAGASARIVTAAIESIDSYFEYLKWRPLADIVASWFKSAFSVTTALYAPPGAAPVMAALSDVLQ